MIKSRGTENAKKFILCSLKLIYSFFYMLNRPLLCSGPVVSLSGGRRGFFIGCGFLAIARLFSLTTHPTFRSTRYEILIRGGLTLPVDFLRVSS